MLAYLACAFGVYTSILGNLFLTQLWALFGEYLFYSNALLSNFVFRSNHQWGKHMLFEYIIVFGRIYGA